LYILGYPLEPGLDGMEWDGMKKESKGRNQIQQGDNNLKKTK
jgi:hypothetical protein